jgi:mannose/fructose/N-acetylgalactosamine-specific phosphotransferase system component IIB
MSVALVRIDDRLVHGQVVEGWLRLMRLNHIVVASDVVSADETQKALYFLAVPHGVALQCLSITEAAAEWQRDAWGEDKVIVLLSNPEDTLRLLEAGAPIHSVNVGGLHFREGRVQVLKAVSLDDRDVAALRGLSSRRVALEARPLPLDEPIDLRSYLERWQQDRQSLGEQPR